ncbi:hypothetical protein T310_7165 [Rasamsonia emersonii CBS 393.64]|uniref:FAD-binding domain-containing protein n=1 Tax=Rasamsonia emersonii (strain ATCC 16479 / CBS 393.64 / IMI 116815) TaxID=1408163 RepID=A0A0F4YKQ4_RASE3|nr:hypothetical protein T310_7165 [Rasamsonia emersonii CBS 393.64]KKA18877.1 hypothetical protein T310_7165 [Rasamsonia emersonii CBS 393.64]
MSKITVAIAGGGIASLSLAAGLIKHSQFDVHIYEAVTEYPDRGGGMALHKNAILAMELVDPDLKKAYFSRAILLASDEELELATQVILAAGPDSGQVVGHLGRAKGRRTIARADLLHGWREIPSERIHFGKKLVDIEEQGTKIELRFQDGTTAVAECLIGADGVHSCTRKYLLGADHPATALKNHDGWVTYSRQVPWTRPVRSSGTNGPRMFLFSAAQTLSCGVHRRTAGSDQTDRPFKKEYFAAYNDDSRAIVELVSRDPSAHWTLQDHDPEPYYYKNNIAMIGDAAHATMPFAGNGAGQAIEDAAVLKALFSRVTDPSQIAKAFAAFDAVRRERSQRVVEISRNFGRLYSYSLDEVGVDPEKMTRYLTEKGSYLNDVDLEAQNRDAIALYEAC